MDRKVAYREEVPDNGMQRILNSSVPFSAVLLATNLFRLSELGGAIQNR